MKEIEWSKYYGVGTIVCGCDACGSTEEFEFEDNKPDFAAAQRASQDGLDILEEQW